MKSNLIYLTVFIGISLAACNGETKLEEKPEVKTNYVMPTEMIQDKNGNLRFKDNYLAPKSEGDSPVKVYPNPKKEDGVEVIKVN